jgi:phosphatidylserine/phosphatidylglycerophosphate/cardiolipin synthase-like enzyme
MKKSLFFSAGLLALTASITAHAGLSDWLNAAQAAGATSAGTGIEVGFSPEGSAEQLVEKAIASAHHSIRLAAYSFTSPAVVRGLVAAKHRGVDVAVVVDEKNNLREDRSGKGRAALNLLVNAGIPTRTISVYPIHHDKLILVDGETVETGSFNFSEAAARRNSENAIVIWNNPALAKAYLDHWQSRWAQGVDYRSTY